MTELDASFEHRKNMLKLIKYIDIRPPDRSVSLKNNFLISEPKYMLWVLKRTISMRWFFWAPKTDVANWTTNWYPRRNYTRLFSLKLRQSKSNNSWVSKDILMNIHVHCPTSCSVKVSWNLFYSLPSNGSVGINSLKLRQSKGNNYCISETNVTNFDVHHHAIAKFIIEIPLTGLLSSELLILRRSKGNKSSTADEFLRLPDQM